MHRSFVMRATRFELATFWSVARRSIQLSYARIFCLFQDAKHIVINRCGIVKAFVSEIFAPRIQKYSCSRLRLATSFFRYANVSSSPFSFSMVRRYRISFRVSGWI